MTSREYIQRKAEAMGRALEALAPTFADPVGDNPIRPHSELPQRAEVLRVLALLDDIFYPGYRCDWSREEPIETLVIERLDEAYDTLFRQVRRALPLRWQSESARLCLVPDPGWDEETLTAEAERLVEAFFARLPAIRDLLKLDVVAAFEGDPAARGYGEIVSGYPGVRAITAHRVAHELYRLDVPLLPRLMSEHIHASTGIDIHPGATIGECFFIDHGTGVVIGETTEIGRRVKLYQGVTLGAKSIRLDDTGRPVRGVKRHPTIEDDVVIYAGATILGGDTVIGRGAVIGGNVWLTHSVRPFEVVTLRNLRDESPVSA